MRFSIGGAPPAVELAPKPRFLCYHKLRAYVPARSLQSWLSKQKRSELFDALELGTLCGETFASLDAAAAHAPVVDGVDAHAHAARAWDALFVQRASDRRRLHQAWGGGTRGGRRVQREK